MAREGGRRGSERDMERLRDDSRLVLRPFTLIVSSNKSAERGDSVSLPAAYGNLSRGMVAIVV